MGRLEELRINAYLSEIARGYSNNSFIAENLFPTIHSDKEKISLNLTKKHFRFTIPNVQLERIQMLFHQRDLINTLQH